MFRSRSHALDFSPSSVPPKQPVNPLTYFTHTLLRESGLRPLMGLGLDKSVGPRRLGWQELNQSQRREEAALATKAGLMSII